MNLSPLHGGVDRNITKTRAWVHEECRPFTGAWIETPMNSTVGSQRQVAPSRGRGSKLPKRIHAKPVDVSPLHGGVDRNIQ